MKENKNDLVADTYAKLMEALPAKDDPDTKITDEDLEKVIKVLDENRSPLIEMIQNLPSNNGVSEAPSNVMTDQNSIDENLTQEVMVEYDPVTNDSKIIGNAEDYKEKDPFDMDDILNMEEFDRDKIQIDSERLLTIVKEQFELSDDCCTVICDMILDYRKTHTSPSFNDLPEIVKTFINAECVKNNIGSKEARNGVLKSILDDIIDKYMDRYYTIEFDQTFKKFTQEMNDKFSEEVNKISIDAINEYVNYMDDRCQELLKLSEETKDIDKSSLYRDMYLTYKDSVDLDRIKTAIKEKSVKIKKIELEKYNKTFREFNYKYEKSTLNIYDISQCPHILARHVDKKYTNEDIVKFCVFFCKYCKHYNTDYIPNHIFMYYTIYHIILLNFIAGNGNITTEERYNLYHSIIKNIEECMDLLKEYY